MICTGWFNDRAVVECGPGAVSVFGKIYPGLIHHLAGGDVDGMCENRVSRTAAVPLTFRLAEDAKGKKMTRKVDTYEYQSLADCIRSDQVPASEIAEIFNNSTAISLTKGSAHSMLQV